MSRFIGNVTLELQDDDPTVIGPEDSGYSQRCDPPMSGPEDGGD